MKIYWRLRKLDYYSTACELQKIFPELNEQNVGRIEAGLAGRNLEFYKTEKVRTKFAMRLTLPFWCIVVIVLLIFTPIHYVITGHWGYRIKWIQNWIKALGF